MTDGGEMRQLPVKLIIAGGFGVGKTTFVASASDIEPLTTEAAMTTVAEDVDDVGEVAQELFRSLAGHPAGADPAGAPQQRPDRIDEAERNP